MADTLRIKRRTSGAPGAPSGLANAELAYNEVDHTLYYGEGTGGAGGTATVVVPIAGQGLGSSTPPLMDGGSSAGSASQWSRGDHQHPSDTSRAPLNSPVFTGDPQGPTPANTDNDNSLATTAFVKGQRLDQFQPPAAPVNFNGQTITGLGNPVNDQDAANKTYVDGVVQGVSAKGAVRVATTGNIALTGTQSIDGVAVSVNDRVLAKDQTTQAQNGVYVVSTGAWARAADLDTWNELVAAFVFVEEGATNADNGFLCTVDPGGTLGTTPVTWVQFSGAGQITAGNGLVKTGNVIDAVGTSGRIAVYADSIDIDSGYVGQTSITTLGNVTTGQWNGSTVNVSHGGTGTTILTGYIKGTGATPFTAVVQIPASDVAGLQSMAMQSSSNVSISGGTIDGITFDMGTF